MVKRGAPRCESGAGLFGVRRRVCARGLALAGVATLVACSDERTDVRADAETAVVRIEEARDGLWQVDAAGERTRLTAMRVGPFDFDSLAAKQREGEVILYWAAAPVASPDGRHVAYATNREAVAADTSGQSIWLLDLETGRERALLDVAGRSYRPAAWLGGDIVYFGDEPGVWIVGTTGAGARRLAPGTFISSAEDGTAVLVADGLPEHPRLEVITPSRRVRVPDPPPGFVYLPQGTFDRTRILLEASADSGYTRTRFAFDRSSGRLAALE